MKTAILLLGLIAVLVCGCSSTVSQRYTVMLQVKVVNVDQDGMVITIENFGGIGCGQLEDAVLATIQVVAPNRYFARKFCIRLTARGSKEIPPELRALAQVGSDVHLEFTRRLLDFTPKQTIDIADGEVKILKEPSESLKPIPTSLIQSPE